MEFVPDIVAHGSVPSCASEPIHIPGSIQPHGLLLLFDAESRKLVHWAGDFEPLLGVEPAAGCAAGQLLGAPLDALIWPHPIRDGEEPAYIGDLRPEGRARLAMLAHRTGDFLAIELQPAGAETSATPALEQIRAISDRIAAAPTLVAACNTAGEQIRSITGFDRVMIYRFLSDGSGSVIAEARAADAGTFFNHRFPSSDIPRQARDLYRRSLIRTIPDAAYRPMPITPVPHLPVEM